MELANIFSAFTRPQTKVAIANLLKISPELVDQFEEAYRASAIDPANAGFFQLNAKQASALRNGNTTNEGDSSNLFARIVDELVEGTHVWRYKRNATEGKTFTPMVSKSVALANPVTAAEVQMIPEGNRPQLTGTLMKVDVTEMSAGPLLWYLTEMQKAEAKRNEKKARDMYRRFRQGLDILDLDGITYQIIGMNKNSMGYWLPKIAPAVDAERFFKIPETTIIKVPMPLLQLTRLDYMSLTPSTIGIVDEFCRRVFELDESKEYFIKTGTYSSKFDFRNAHVHGAKEVRELGEYLLFIHHQALQMASPLATPCIFGASTTNEWVVREFIPDKDKCFTIYHGLPLRTEYRVFVDFDTQEILGISPYWKPEVMRNRFMNSRDSENPDMVHDAITYMAQEEMLMARYNENKELVLENIKKILPGINLQGQWSIDIMQNGNEFWVIDMAMASDSALSECIPEGKLIRAQQSWIPELQN